jgi:hypothetical protein
MARVTPRVQMATLPGGQPTMVTTTGTQELIDLCSLNDTGTDTGTYDRRVFNRTRAWFDALASRNMLTGVGAAQFAPLWQMVGVTARSVGFFSVWLKVLSTANDPNGGNLADLFVANFATTVPGANPPAFPGTDTTNLP